MTMKATTPAALRVLCVDDNWDAVDSLGALLGLAGFTVSVAHDATAALELADQFHPTAYVLDITMPEIDGYELARRIRSAPGGGEVLLIALTALGDFRSLEHMADSGFDLHFTKPVRSAALFAALRDFASRGRPDA